MTRVAMRLRAYPRVVRPLAVLAGALGAANLVLVAALLARAAARSEVRPPPVEAAVELAALTLAPWCAAALARRARAGDAAVEGGALVLRLRDRRVDVPLDALAAARAWRVPLPGPGVALRMRSGARFRLALEAARPDDLLRALAAAGVPAVAAPGAAAAWAEARRALRPGPVERALRWAAFPLLPAAVLFHAHQAIAFGGFLGEWRLAGPGAWLRTLVAFWVAALALLVLLAAGARGVAEVACAAATALAPARAGAARRAAEWLCRAVLYAGVPALLAARFLA